MSPEGYSLSDKSLLDTRAFLFHTLNLNELFSGDGYTRDEDGNMKWKGFAIEGTVAPFTDANPLPIAASGYAGVSETSVKCIFGCNKNEQSDKTNNNPNLKDSEQEKRINTEINFINKPYSITQNSGKDGVIYAYGSRTVNRGSSRQNNENGGCNKDMSCA